MAWTREQIAAASDQELLIKLSEESSEVIKAALKWHQYGATPLAGGVQYDNVADLASEWNETIAITIELMTRQRHDWRAGFTQWFDRSDLPG